MREYVYSMTTDAYARKPVGNEVRRVRSSMHQTKSTDRELLNYILAGHAWMPAIMAGGQMRDNWQKQQLIGLDFDNTVIEIGLDGKPVKDADGKSIKRCLQPGEPGFILGEGVLNRLAEHGIAPLIAYESYSSSEICRRFRFVLGLSKPCDDAATMENALDRLLVLFPEADQSCKDLPRLFFGTRFDASWILFPRVYDHYVDTDIQTLLNLPERPQPQPPTKTYPTPRERCGSIGDYDDFIRNVDLLAIIQSDTGELGRKSGKALVFHNCPICGHRDCFAFYKDTNSWTCFSDSNTTGIRGGNAVDYLTARYGMGFIDAISFLSSSSPVN